MKLYILYSGTVTSASYTPVGESISVDAPVTAAGADVSIDIPDTVLSQTDATNPVIVTINGNVNIPVKLSNNVFLDEIDVDKYIADNTYVANVNLKAAAVVRYKDLYKILCTVVNGTSARILNLLDL